MSRFLVRARRPGGLTGPSGFAAAVALAADALDSLNLRAQALAVAATDEQDAENARQAQIFATRAGPRALERIKVSGSGTDLQLLQRGITGVTSNVTGSLVDDVIQRFVLMDLGFLLAGPFGLAAGAVSPEVLDEARNVIGNIPTPPAPQDLPTPAFVGGGALAGAAMSFASTGNPRAAVGGAVAGGVLGFLLQRGLRKLGDMFSVGKK